MPALSLPSALVAIAVGCLVGNLMLAVAGLIGAQARVPAMTLMRAPLGTRGSFLPTAINVVQCLGWTVFELLVIATAAAALSDELLGFGAQWLWTLVFGAAALAMGLLGPIGVVRTVLRRVAVWAMPLAIGYLTWWALTGGGLVRRLEPTGRGWPLRLAGHRHRRRRDGLVGAARGRLHALRPLPPRAAFWGTGIGYLLPDALLLALGAVILLTREVGDAAALPAAVAAGGIVALLALFVLTVAETDEAFANAYSGAVSLQNLFPARAAAAADRRDDDGRDRRRPRARADELPVVPLPARLLLRAAVRGAARRLAGRRAALRRRRRLRRAAWRPGCLPPGSSASARTSGCRLPARAVGRPGPAARPACLGHRRDAAELRRLVRGRARRGGHHAPHATARRPLARATSTIAACRGRDHREPRARRRRRSTGTARRRRLVLRPRASRRSTPTPTSCSSAARPPEDREALVPALEEFGFPVRWRPAERTTRFSFHYDGRPTDHGRSTSSRTRGHPPTSTAGSGDAIGDATWVIVGALTRADFPLETLAALTARGHRLVLDAQGLVRHGRRRPARRATATIDRRCSATSRR